MPTKQEPAQTSPIGRATPRVDGPQKVTGTAKYTSDFHFPGMLYAVPVEATIANGRLLKLDPAAAVKLDQTYVTPTETHNPLELHATVAVWDGAMLTLYEASQGVFNLQGVLAQMFGLPRENVRVITQFLGSGFGGKLFPWTHSP